MMAAVWMLPVLPLAAFLILLLMRKVLSAQGAWLSIMAIFLTFALYCGILLDFLSHDAVGGDITFTWARFETVDITIGFKVDSLSMLMAGLISFVSLMVQVYSLGYMRGESRFGLYFAYHSLFAASMLTLVLSNSFLLLYIGWELVGLCSFLLIGFWWEKRSAAEAAKKAFITTRFGDVGLFIALGILFVHAGTFDIDATFASLGTMGAGLLTVTGLCLFVGAMGKSAQVPFHVWLPDAMEGPTPVSALIHAATMVTAGVFLVARAFPVLEAAGVLPVVAAVGIITALFAGAMALATRDIKRVLAYSTVSQLGFMMVAMGFSNVQAGMFHLVTHGFFKALLFLSAGAVLHAIHKANATVDDVHGIRKHMPLVAFVFAVGTLALAGVPPLSGFFSKEQIIGAALEEGSVFYAGLLLVGSFLTALYMTRLYVMLFTGAPNEAAHHTHDPEPALAGPLLLLSVLAIGVGAALAPFIGSLHLEGGHEGFHFDPVLAGMSTAVALAGMGLGWTLYRGRLDAPAGVRSALGSLPGWATAGFGFDRAYQWVINTFVVTGSKVVYYGFDRPVINDVGVNGSAGLSVKAGKVLRLVQTGKVYNYALFMAVGVIVLAGGIYYVSR